MLVFFSITYSYNVPDQVLEFDAESGQTKPVNVSRYVDQEVYVGIMEEAG